MLWWQHALGTARFVWPWAAARLAVLLTFCFLLLSTACEHRTTLVDPNAPSDSLIDDGGTVQKATLTVTVAVRGADSVLASVLGASGGVLTNAEVTIVRSRSGESYADTTDAAGTVRFERILPGRYSVSVLRTLTAEEYALILAQGADINAFAGARSVEVSSPMTEGVVFASAGEPGSLVISEYFPGLAQLPSGGGYQYGQFTELYNNSNATIYLDGKILFEGMIHGFRAAPWHNCVGLEPWQTDPDGLWTMQYVVAFPGSGQDYPLAPGQTAVVALDAIDHREFVAGLHDLSEADFELTEEGDVDNPAVPNMVNLGRVCCGGHGMRWGWGDVLMALGQPVDVSSLRRDYPPLLLEHWLIPADKILDVLVGTPTPEIEAVISGLFAPLCPRIVHESFDRQPAAIVDDESLEGIQRRVFAVLPDGRKVLQRTKTSSRDFVARYPATPGFIPE